MSTQSVAIPLGARVRFARRIQRDEHPRKRGHTWNVVPDSPGEGVFIGYRYKQNGVWEFYDECTSWQETGRVKVALVVTRLWEDAWTVDPVGLELDCACDGVGMCSEHIRDMLEAHPGEVT